MFRKKQQHEEPADVPEVVTDHEAITETKAPVLAARSRERASIGASIRIRGDVEGEEDVLVRGHVEGTVSLRNHRLTVGEEGDVSATITAGVVDVEGRVEGDVNAADQVVVRASGKVIGTIRSPRVTLEDGCRFKGTIDMDVEPAARAVGGAKVADFKPLSVRSDDESGQQAR